MIDEKKLIEDLEKESYKFVNDDLDNEWNRATFKAIEIIKEQPQAGYGAGKWMDSVCSCCGESVSEWYNFKFCPMCGAKMEDYEE